MDLCDICADLQKQGHEPQDDEAPWHLKYMHDLGSREAPSALEISARSGCSFCKQFWDSLTEQHHYIMSTSDQVDCTIWLYWDQEKRSYTKLRFILGSEFDGCPDGLKDTFELLQAFEESSSETRSSKNMMSRWLNICTQNHKNDCCTTQPTRWLPFRLIDIGNCMAGDPAEDGFDGLLHANIEDWLITLPLDDFPALFQSACLAVELFGFRYIWIDMICVIQDSNEDLMRQLPLRAHVFQHCALTLTAESPDAIVRALEQDGALDSSIGIGSQSLSRRDSMLPGPATIAVPENLWADEMVDGPMSCDATCFQDQLFAPRRLHFGATQMFWHCTGLKACEMFQNGLPQQMLQNPINDSILERALRQVQLQSKSNSRLDKSAHGVTQMPWIDLWHLLVRRYSQCSKFTRGTRLLGISGITSELGALTGDTSIAGLWQSNLINDLLWYIDDSAPQRPELSCAPTWSWASIEGPIQYFTSSKLYGNFVKIVDVHASGVENNMYLDDPVTASLHLDGYLLKILPGPFMHSIMLPDCKNDITKGHHFCLPLRLQKSADGDYLCGLVLRRTETSQYYERVGMFRCGEGDELHILGLETFGRAYTFTKDPGEVVNNMTMVKDITIL
ncbi:hypothetical protein FB567DRAFT_628341 [Paraphoma chrysanthemicola]|uniref:Heterokaryon incompatibility domain-containing protein n=1 Tax=Paraphoma chrysanthemicola TaxID=798071 RepID=A0A8K0VY20_9PLEO|nr:hypothetical protein FB567DRAFT_628341 [Paraphoma chrysanthemicola]